MTNLLPKLNVPNVDINGKKMKQPTVISLFAGGGGSSLGYKMAGFKELLAVEWDKSAVEVLKKNFPGLSIYHGDIKTLNEKECAKLAKIKPGELDLLDGSPPCQGFSMANKNRKVIDKKNELYLEFARILKYLKPKMFLIENVVGMTTGKMKFRYLEMLSTYRELGYFVKGMILNAAHYGTPQNRHRTIILGRIDKEPTFPTPETKLISVKEALSGIIVNQNNVFKNKEGSKIIKQMSQTKQGQTNLSYNTQRRLSWHRPSPAILTSRARAHWHPAEDRPLILAELKKLSGFPDDFWFPGEVSGIKIIGNCVPPPLMTAIAKHIIKQLEEINAQ